MDKETAEKLITQVRDLARVLNDMSHESMGIEDEAARQQYRKNLGEIMGQVDSNLRKYITDRFPELDVVP